MTEKEFADLVDELRKAANMWFRKEDILKLEKLIELACLDARKLRELVGENFSPVPRVAWRSGEDGDHAAS